MTAMTDLFGNGQQSLFGDAPGRIPHPPPPSMLPDPEDIRRRLNAVLDIARKADRMPWPEKRARVWQIIFPNMANWLPEDEANQLRFEFAAEMERLKLAA